MPRSASWGITSVASSVIERSQTAGSGQSWAIASSVPKPPTRSYRARIFAGDLVRVADDPVVVEQVLGRDVVVRHGLGRASSSRGGRPCERCAGSSRGSRGRWRPSSASLAGLLGRLGDVDVARDAPGGPVGGPAGRRRALLVACPSASGAARGGARLMLIGIQPRSPASVSVSERLGGAGHGDGRVRLLERPDVDVLGDRQVRRRDGEAPVVLLVEAGLGIGPRA